MITIIKKEIKISPELLSKIEWACTLNNFCTPTGTLSSTEIFLPSQNSNYGTSSKPFKVILNKILKT